MQIQEEGEKDIKPRHADNQKLFKEKQCDKENRHGKQEIENEVKPQDIQDSKNGHKEHNYIYLKKQVLGVQN